LDSLLGDTSSVPPRRPSFIAVQGGTAEPTGDALAPTARRASSGALLVARLIGHLIGRLTGHATASGRYEGRFCRLNASKGSRDAMVS